MNINSAKLRCLHPTFSLVTLVRGVGGKCPGWFILPPSKDLCQTLSSVNSHGTIILEYLVVRDVNFISAKQIFTSNIQFGYPVGGVGGKLSRLVYLAPHPGFGSNSVISYFLLHHNLGIFSCKRYKHYFSQTEMFTSNIQFGYSSEELRQAVQAGLSCPPPRIWVEQCHQLILIISD